MRYIVDKVARYAIVVATVATAGCMNELDQSDKSSGLVTAAPDYVETAVSDPPASAAIGSTFSIDDTAANTGTADATSASTTAFYLSLDAVKSGGDVAMTGTRSVPALAMGATSPGTTTVTVPGAAAGSYYVLACADSTNAIAESSETNNCHASAMKVSIQGPDLVETAVSDPPSTYVSGDAFSITDTVQNSGAGTAGTSITRYFLSTDGIHVATGTQQLGSRPVGSLGAGAIDTAPASLASKPGTPQGTYFILACADKANTVVETNENNNCLASTNTMALSAPDLTEGSVTASPSPIDANAMLTVTDTTTNSTMTAAGASVTRFYLSSDNVRNPGDAFVRACTNGGLVPEHDAPALAAGASDSGSTTFALCVRDASGLHQVQPGSYYVLACADETQVVSESDETNNCASTGSPITVTLCGNNIVEAGEQCDDGNTVSGDGCSATCQSEPASDLVETAVSDPPATAALGSTFQVTDTVTNNSAGGSTTISTTTKYYLSSDRVKSGGDAVLTGNRTVPPLTGNSTSTGTVTVTIPSVAAGTYYLIACADANNNLPETNENNNCLTSANTVTLSGADLVVTAVSNPPAANSEGTAFTVSDTTQNNGSQTAGASTTRYYLSLDAIHIASGTVSIGSRPVPSLTAGAPSSGSGSATVAAGTPEGSYYVLACADFGAGASVPETNENNNCHASAMTVAVTAPDLIEENVTVAPASVPTGGSIVVGDTATNQNMTGAGASATRFYVSADAVRNAGDLLLRSCTAPGPALQRGVPAFASAGSSTGTSTLTLCYNSGGLRPVPAGTYYVLACADDPKVISETNENNNCAASATQFTITP